MPEAPMKRNGLIERRITFTPDNFDTLKEYQRECQKTMGMRLSNSEVIATILAQLKRQEG